MSKPTKRQIESEERRAKVKERWDKGVSVGQIAERLSLSRTTVRRDLEIMGVKVSA